MLISLPLIFFYKIRFIPSMNQYVPRFFLALKAILQFVAISVGIYAFLIYAYNILNSSMSYNLGDTEKDFPDFSRFQEQFNFVRVADYINLSFRESLKLIITAIVALFFLFVGSSMTKADSQAAKDLNLQKYLNLAHLMNENGFLINKDEKYKDARYVIVTRSQKSKKEGGNDVANEEEKRKADEFVDPESIKELLRSNREIK